MICMISIRFRSHIVLRGRVCTELRPNCSAFVMLRGLATDCAEVNTPNVCGLLASKQELGGKHTMYTID